MDVAACPEKAEAGEEANESAKVARLLDEGADTKLVGLINLSARHGAGIHHDRDVLENRVLFEVPQHSEAVENGHAMVENNHARLADRAVAEAAFAVQAVENFLSVMADE